MLHYNNRTNRHRRTSKRIDGQSLQISWHTWDYNIRQGKDVCIKAMEINDRSYRRRIKTINKLLPTDKWTSGTNKPNIGAVFMAWHESLLGQLDRAATNGTTGI